MRPYLEKDSAKHGQFSEYFFTNRGKPIVPLFGSLPDNSGNLAGMHYCELPSFFFYLQPLPKLAANISKFAIFFCTHCQGASGGPIAIERFHCTLKLFLVLTVLSKMLKQSQNAHSHCALTYSPRPAQMPWGQMPTSAPHSSTHYQVRSSCPNAPVKHPLAPILYASSHSAAAIAFILHGTTRRKYTLGSFEIVLLHAQNKSCEF